MMGVHAFYSAFCNRMIGDNEFSDRGFHPDVSRNGSGATAIEYGLIAAGIAVAIIAVVNGMGTKLKSTFSSVSTELK